MCDFWHASECWFAGRSSKTITFVSLTHAMGVGEVLGTHVELGNGRGRKSAAVAGVLLFLVGSRDYKVFVDTRIHIRSWYKMNAIVYWVAQGTGPQ